MNLKTKLALNYAFFPLTTVVLAGACLFLLQDLARTSDEVIQETAPQLVALGDAQSAFWRMVDEAKSVALIQELVPLDDNDAREYAAMVAGERSEVELAILGFKQALESFGEAAESEEEQQSIQGMLTTWRRGESVCRQIAAWSGGGRDSTELFGQLSDLEELEEIIEGSLVAARKKELWDLREASLRITRRSDTDARRALVACAIAVVVSAGFGVRVWRSVAGPVAELTGAVGRFRDGETDARVDPASRDELGELARAFNEMAATVEDREGRLEEAVRKAKEAGRAKSEFLARMSHELRTPMNAILGMAEFLVDSDLKPEQREYAAIVGSAGADLLNMINEVLDFSKIEAGKIELDASVIDCVETVEAVCGLLGEQAWAGGLELRAELDRRIPRRLLGDAGRLRQILINLVGNAIKFTETGEVIVRATMEDGDENEVVLRVSVTDTGIGIPAEAIECLFDAFSQADTSTTRRYGGTGLGLAISSQLVEAMGGRLTVVSEVGAGTEFSFAIPLPRVGGPPDRDEALDSVASEQQVSPTADG